MTFDEEWAELTGKARAKAHPDSASMRLAHADGGPGARPSPVPGPTTRPDLSLDDGPVREKARRTHAASSQGRHKARLKDAEAAGRAHAGWDAGAASDSCVRSWQDHLHELGDLVEDATDALTRAMNAQISHDSSVAGHMRAGGKWLEGA